MNRPLIGIIDQGIADLYPGYFSLVMATGIISIAAHLLLWVAVAEILLVFNLAAYIILWLFLLIRIFHHPKRLIEDLKSFGKSAGFFTIVAGTCVLGSQVVILKGWYQVGSVLFILGLGLWIFLIYLFFLLRITADSKPPLDNGINGAWLIVVVATQSISVLGSTIIPSLSQFQEYLLFFTLFMYLLGCMLYIFLFTLILYRLLYFRLSPETLSPTYWIGMGAIAITTLAGARLLLNSSLWAFLSYLVPFVQSFTLFFWTFATWLIPLLILLGIWRHWKKRYPIRYTPEYWGMVFPLGMYTVSTLLLAKSTHLNFLTIIPQVFIYVALAAWLATLSGLVNHLIKSLSGLSDEEGRASKTP